MAAVLVLVLATGVAVAGAFGVWAKRQALETGPWVDTSERLLENEEIRDELGRELSARVLEVPAVRDRLASLPQDEADALRKTVRTKAPDVLGSQAALRAWRTANRRAHVLLLRFLDGDRDTVVLNVRALLREVAAESGVPADLVDQVPRDITTITIVAPGRLQSARKGADVLRTLAIVLPLLAALLFALAVLIAPDRRRALGAVGVCLLGTGLFVLVLRHVAQGVVIDGLGVDGQTRPAADATWSIATSLLVGVATVTLLVGVVLAIAAVIAEWRRGDAEDAEDDHDTQVMPPLRYP
jgi:hypothetical protein